jgi:N-acetylmuramoyl-L-alanine amidase
MEPFTRYKINETEDGVEVVLYLDDSLTEFSDELGTVSKMEDTNLKKEAESFVKRKFPSLKVKSIKIMAGAMLLSTLGFAALPAEEASAAEITSYTVSAGDTLYGIAKKYGTSVDAIKSTNGLSSNFIDVGQNLSIPSGATSATAKTTSSHTVSSGDTLYSIAKKYGTSVDAIKAANGLSSNFIDVGQTLSIPTGGTAAPAQNTSSSHQVSSGDTLYSIAKKYGTSVDAIKAANGMSSNFIDVGQTLSIPNGTASAPTQSTSTSYQVVSGDTLYSIADRHGTTVDAIKASNGMSSNFIDVGQRLTIPTGNSIVPPAPKVETEQRSEVNQEDVEWLAKMIHSEAKGESFEGQVAVGAVIMNRVESDLFPNTIKEVLLEQSNGYYQFTPAETGILHTATPNDENYEAAKRAINGEDPTNGALFFYNPDKTSSSYLKSRTVSTVIGNHTFAF